MLINLGGSGFPTGESAFTEAFDDLAQPSHDGFTLHVARTTTLGQPRMQTDPRCCDCRAIRPAGNAQRSG
ncbi:hypothetical protein D3C84_1247260 [compost metagenome]